MLKEYNLAEPQIFGEFLKKMRESYLVNNEKLTSKKLSSILGVSPATITKWESGSAYPTIDKIAILSQFYGVTIDDLLSAKNNNYIEKVNDLASYLKSQYKSSLLNYDEKKKKAIVSDFISYLKVIKDNIDSSSSWNNFKSYFIALGLEFAFNSVAIIYKIDSNFKVFEKDLLGNKNIAYFLPVNKYYHIYMKQIIDSGYVYDNIENLKKDISEIPEYDKFEELAPCEEYIIKDIEGNKAVIKTGKILRMLVLTDENELEKSYNRLITQISEANRCGAKVKNSDFIEIGEFYNVLGYLVDLILKDEYKSYLYEIIKIGFKRINEYLYSTYIDKVSPKDYDLNTIAMFTKFGVEVKNETYKKYFDTHKI